MVCRRIHKQADAGYGGRYLRDDDRGQGRVKVSFTLGVEVQPNGVGSGEDGGLKIGGGAKAANFHAEHGRFVEWMELGRLGKVRGELWWGRVRVKVEVADIDEIERAASLFHLLRMSQKA